MEKDITIKDVAKLANVSIATVSRVVNDNYNVSGKLKDRVLSAIEELKYVPNSIARSLKCDHTLTIGLVVSDISNSFFTALARSAEDIIMRKGYNLIVCSTDDNKAKESSYLQLLLEKKVDGIILNTTGKNDELITSISHNIPIALCSRKVMNSEFIGDFVESDNIKGVMLLTKHLLDQGHKRIAVINGQQDLSTSLERFRGFKIAMEEFGISVSNDYLYNYNGNFNKSDSGEDAMKYLLALDPPPTAVITMNNELTLGVIRYCMKNNIDIPKDISICSYGEISNSDLMIVQPSYVPMDPISMGTTLAEMVIERISKISNSSNREVRFRSTLVPGNGVAKIDEIK